MTDRGLWSGSSEVTIASDGAAVASALADEILRTVLRNPSVVLGLATGSSPAHAYRLVADRAPRGAFARTQAFALDEYVGLPDGHERSYRAELLRDFAVPLGLAGDRLHVPDPADPAVYDGQILDAGGVDLQILGIGRNGHIAFNEPGTPRQSRTRVVRLAGETRHDNARFFASQEEVPRYAATQGIETILAARRIVLVAHGAHKASAIRAALDGPIGSAVPASFLRFHDNVTIIVDRALADVAGFGTSSADARRAV